MDGVEGLVHISELAQQHVENPREIVAPGDEIRVRILEIDSERRRLSLSIKRVEDQILPLKNPAGDAGDLDDMPELGLSEDVFTSAPAEDEAAASEDDAVAETETETETEPDAASGDAPVAEAPADAADGEATDES
jgi:small subunit ribosomal protein S1